MPTVTALKTMFLAQIVPDDANADSEFLRILTEADMRLLEFGRWRWTRRKDTLTPVDGFVTLPTRYAAILGARVGKEAVDLVDEDYEFVSGGPGEVDLGNGYSRLIDQGLVEIPDPASFASVTINPSGANNSFTLTALTTGTGGEDISITVAAGVANTDVTVSDTGITVTPGKVSMTIGAMDGAPLMDGGTPITFPELFAAGDVGGFPSYEGTGDARLYYDDAESRWTLTYSAGIEWINYDSVATPDLLSEGSWQAAGGLGEPTVSAVLASAAQVITAINADPEASLLVLATPSGNVTGPIAPVAQTFLNGGSTTLCRQYKVAGYLDTDDIITALMHFAPATLYDPAIADSSVPEDAVSTTICPSPTALKHMMMAIRCEESKDLDGARSYVSDALKGLDNKEQSQRGNATRTIQARPMGRRIGRVRGWR